MVKVAMIPAFLGTYRSLHLYLKHHFIGYSCYRNAFQVDQTLECNTMYNIRVLLRRACCSNIRVVCCSTMERSEEHMAIS